MVQASGTCQLTYWTEQPCFTWGFCYNNNFFSFLFTCYFCDYYSVNYFIPNISDQSPCHQGIYIFEMRYCSSQVILLSENHTSVGRLKWCLVHGPLHDLRPIIFLICSLTVTWYLYHGIMVIGIFTNSYNDQGNHTSAVERVGCLYVSIWKWMMMDPENSNVEDKYLNQTKIKNKYTKVHLSLSRM